MISVICVYNNRESLKNYLLPVLNLQSCEHESILIDNTDGRFKSSAEALNYGARKAKGEYLMFIHQDVDLESSSWLEDVHKILDKLPHLGVAGVAGMSLNGKNHLERQRNIIKHEVPPVEWGNAIEKPEEVETVDECLFIIPRKVFQKLEFDEETCPGWHLYGVDYCLSCHEQGLKVYVLPLSVYHLSAHAGDESPLKTALKMGYHPPEYYDILPKVMKKHRNHFSKIYTTCGEWDTKTPLLIQRAALTFNLGINFLKRKVKGSS
ncbi:MAG TPA: glycosyltransferase [Methanobacteriaceae archaeon]|nr:glycosyltransferase [Methanobacteriaceae archaeon]